MDEGEREKDEQRGWHDTRQAKHLAPPHPLLCNLFIYLHICACHANKSFPGMAVSSNSPFLPTHSDYFPLSSQTGGTPPRCPILVRCSSHTSIPYSQSLLTPLITKQWTLPILPLYLSSYPSLHNITTPALPAPAEPSAGLTDPCSLPTAPAAPALPSRPPATSPPVGPWREQFRELDNVPAP